MVAPISNIPGSWVLRWMIPSSIGGCPITHHASASAPASTIHQFQAISRFTAMAATIPPRPMIQLSQ
jgi:hypothetical protein